MLNLYRDAGTLVVYAGAAPEKAPEVVSLILKEFGRLHESLVSSQELKRAKEYVKGSVMLSLESSSSRMTHLAQQLMYYGRFYKLEEILDAVDRVTARDIRHLANKMFDDATLALTALSNRNGRDLNTIAIHV
jgi:predicted Zn-dependent peptidase